MSGHDGIASPDPSPDGSDGAGPRWILVVARGHSDLLADLEAIFRRHPRVEIIEDRREGPGLLSRPDRPAETVPREAARQPAGTSAGRGSDTPDP
jgi:hypothetical protein